MFKVKKVRLLLAFMMLLIFTCTVMGCGSNTPTTSKDAPKEEPQKVYVMKYDYYTTQDNEQAAVDKWYFDEVAKRSNGRIKIDYYWAGALHKTGQHYAAVKDGLSELSFIQYGYYMAELPISRVMEWTWRPYLDSAEVGFKVANKLYDESPVWQKEYEDVGLKILYMSNFGYNTCLFAKPITSLDQLKGLKLRSFGVESDALNALGAVPLSVAAPETYTSLERKIIDGVTCFGTKASYTMKISEIAPHVTIMKNSVLGPGAVIMTKKLWDELPDDLKKIFNDVKQELLDGKFAELMNKAQSEGVEGLAKSGSTINILSDEDIQKATEIVLPIQEKNWINDMVKLKLMTESEARDMLAKLDNMAKEMSPGTTLNQYEHYQKLKKEGKI